MRSLCGVGDGRRGAPNKNCKKICQVLIDGAREFPASLASKVHGAAGTVTMASSRRARRCGTGDRGHA
jgi:hypothetical protein